VVPVAAALFGNLWVQLLGVLCWLLIALSFVPTLRAYRRSPFWGLALPGIALLYTAFTINSAIEYYNGRGGMWKGRAQANLSGSR
jgi:hypothetical protein